MFLGFSNRFFGHSICALPFWMILQHFNEEREWLSDLVYSTTLDFNALDELRATAPYGEDSCERLRYGDGGKKTLNKHSLECCHTLLSTNTESNLGPKTFEDQ